MLSDVVTLDSCIFRNLILLTYLVGKIFAIMNTCEYYFSHISGKIWIGLSILDYRRNHSTQMKT